MSWRFSSSGPLQNALALQTGRLCAYGPAVQEPSSKTERLRGLYPLIDADACQQRGLDLLECARAVIDAGPPIFQLRAKGRSAGVVLAWAEALAKLLPSGGPRLVINDRADIAAAVGAAFVHVGQDDLPAEELARRYPSLAVGLSTHDEAQLGEALEMAGLGYVALGPIFPTYSKENPEPALSVGRLEAAYERTRVRGMSLVAIGGITEETLPDVSRASDLVAAISLILPSTQGGRDYSWIRERCASLDRMIASER